MSDIDPRDAAQHGEVLKASMRMNKDGTYVTFFLNPADEDSFSELVRAHAGARYQMVVVRLTDQDEPDVPEDVAEGKKYVTSAAMLCKEEGFQRWLYNNGYAIELSEEAAIEAVRDYCSIDSRAELQHDPDAQKKFKELRDEYFAESI